VQPAPKILAMAGIAANDYSQTLFTLHTAPYVDEYCTATL